MLRFSELMEKLDPGYKQVKKFKGGKRKNNEVIIAKKGNKFAAYIKGELLDNSFKSQKDAEKAANDFMKLMGEETE